MNGTSTVPTDLQQSPNLQQVDNKQDIPQQSQYMNSQELQQTQSIFQAESINLKTSPKQQTQNALLKNQFVKLQQQVILPSGGYELGFERPVKEIKSENIENRIMIERLQEKIRKLEDSNKLYVSRFNQIYDERKLHKKIIIDKQVKEINELKEDQQSQIETIRSIKKVLLQMDVNHQKEIEEALESNQEEVSNKKLEIDDQREQLKNINAFKRVRMQIQEEVNNMRDQLNEERQQHSHVLNEIENDKVARMEKMRKDMLLRVKEVKTAMLNLTEDKLQGTTRLTIKQNKQLTSELEYQSKQTEHLMFQNFQMQNEILKLKKDQQVHEEVEKELAKRSHFCQKVIEKYKEQQRDLKQEIQDIKDDRYEDADSPTKQKNLNDTTANEDLAEFLKTRIRDIEGKLKMASLDHESLSDEYQFIDEKLEKDKKKYKNLALLLTEYLDHIIENNSQVIVENQDMHLDVESFKDYDDIEDAPDSDKVALMLVMLKQLQPLLTDNQRTQPNQHSNQIDNNKSIESTYRSVVSLNRPSIISNQQLNLKSQINRYQKNKLTQSHHADRSPLGLSKSPYSNNLNNESQSNLDQDSTRKYTLNFKQTALSKQVITQLDPNRRTKLITRNQRVFNTQQSSNPLLPSSTNNNNLNNRSFSNNKYYQNLNNYSTQTATTAGTNHTKSLMILKKENTSDSIQQAYSNYGMRHKLRDIENKMNVSSVESTQRKVNQGYGMQFEGNKSQIEMGSNSLRLLPKLNNSFL
eukprot:403347929